MKKIIIPVICSIFALAVGYLIGGMRSGRIATEQAYHSDLSYLTVINGHLQKNETEKAKEVSEHAIRGALGVLDTFQDDVRSPLVFILPTSEILLDSSAKTKIRSQAELTISEEVASLGSIQSR
jgi:K+-sensing histidine kinase KdpD